MGTVKTPDRAVRDLLRSIPAGYVIGRLGSGDGPAQLLPIKSLLAAITQSGGGSGGGGGSSTLAGLTDVLLATPSDGQVLEYVASASKWENKTLSISTTFTALTDAPASYSGKGLYNVRVNSGASALEFWSWTTNDQTASYTLALTDADQVVRYNSASAGTITVPPNSSVAFPVGTIVEVRQIGAGALTVAAGVGVTINAPFGLFINRQHASGRLHKTATNTWNFTLLSLGPKAELPAIAQISAGATLSLDRNNGEVQRLSLTATVTSFSVSNWPASGTLGRLILEIQNTGAFGISSWPSGTVWPAGTAPTITSGSGKKDVVILMTFDGGTTIYGTLVGADYR
jgi:hypothetical protein